jgi:hypothetical protein
VKWQYKRDLLHINGTDYQGFLVMNGGDVVSQCEMGGGGAKAEFEMVQCKYSAMLFDGLSRELLDNQ